MPDELSRERLDALLAATGPDADQALLQFAYHARIHEPSRGLEACDEALRRHPDEEDPAHLDALLWKSTMLRRLRQFDEASQLARRALYRAAAADDTARAAQALRRLALIASRYGDWDGAVEHTSAAVVANTRAARQDPEERDALARTLVQFVRHARRVGAHAAADVGVDRLRALADTAPEVRWRLAYALGSLSTTVMYRGDIRRAVALADEALALAEQLDTHPGLVRAHTAHVRLLSQLGSFAQARDHADRAVDHALAGARVDGRPTVDEGNALNVRAAALVGAAPGLAGPARATALSRARADAARALEVFKQRREQTGRATALRWLGHVEAWEGRDGAAAALLRQAAGLIRSQSTKARVLQELSEVLTATDPAGAREALDDSLTEARGEGVTFQAERSRLARGRLLARHGDLDDDALAAEADLRQAEEYFAGLARHREIGEAQAGRAWLGARRMLGVGTPDPLSTAGLAALREAGATYSEMGAVADAGLEAVEQYEQGRAELATANDRAVVSRRHRNDYLLALHLCVAAGRHRDALTVIEAMRADLQATLFRYHLEELPEDVRAVVRELQEAEAQGVETPDPDDGEGDGFGGPIRAVVRDEEHLRARCAALEQSLGSVALRRVLAPQADDVGLGSSLGELPGHWLVYELLSTAETSQAVWCWTAWIREGHVTVEATRLNPGSAELVDDLCRGELGRLTDEDPAWESLAADLLPAGLRDRLAVANPADGPAEITIVPAGGLWRVPFAALPVAGAPLIRHAVLRMLPTTRPVEPPDKAVSNTAVAYLDAELERPGIARERDALEELRRRFEILLIDQPGEVSAALRTRPRREAGVVSAHGDGAPGLAHALQLRGRVRVTAGSWVGAALPSLLVTGACSSGHVAIEPGAEPIGLPTVALAGGVQTMLATLYPVDSEPSATLLAVTYRGVADGHEAVEALRSAQLSLIDNGEDLYDWSGFVAFGAPLSRLDRRFRGASSAPSPTRSTNDD